MTTNGGTISTNSNTVALTTNNEQVEIKSHSRTSSTTSSLRNRMGTNTNPTPTATTSARYPAVKSTNANRQIEQIGKYRLLKTIGKGNFAKVKLARHISTHKEVAIKIIDKTQLNPTSLLKLFREVKIMKLIGDHPNIVKLFQVIETEKTLYLVMEYISGGEVFEYLVTNGRLKEKEARSKFRQIVSAVQYLHQKNIIHRDLKAENLLLDKDMNIKLVDYGFSNEFVPGNKLETYCGSPPYAAPELFQGRKYDGPEVDVWSLGVILYTLVSGSLPFDGSTLRELRERVIRGKYRIPFYMSTDCENLLRKFLVLNPTKRFTLEQIMKDKWMNVGHEDNELLPFIEPSTDVKDQKRIESLMTLGYNLADIEQSISKRKYDDIHATYLLLDGSNKLPTNSKSSEGSLSPRSGSTTATANSLTQPIKHSSVHRSSSSSSKRRSSSSGETLKTFTPSKTAQNKVIDDTKKISSKQAINEKTPAITTASNFKRQNTIDSALMKEKNSSHSTNTIIARPMSAIPKSTEKPVEKARTSLKYELSNATCLNTPKRPTTLYEDANHKAAPTEKQQQQQTKDNAIAVNLNPAANSFVRPSLAFPRNVPSRSTFHSGQTRNVSRTSSTMGTPSGESPYSGGKGNFLQRLTTRFSKRFRLSNSKTNNNNNTNNTSNN